MRVRLNEVVKRMRGEVGTEITLTILHEGAPGPFEITLIRAVIKVASVKSRVLAEGYGYLRISRFQSHTGEDLRDAVCSVTLHKQQFLVAVEGVGSQNLRGEPDGN